MNQKPLPKRFYGEATWAPDGDGYIILLDEKPAKNIRREPLIAPTKRLAEKIVSEWNEQKEEIDLSAMPCTSILGAALAGDQESREFWLQEIAAYLGSDLLCYRAERPDELVARQTQMWDPFLNWFEKRFDGRLAVAAGVMAINQDSALIGRFQADIEREPREFLFALHALTALTGSAVLAYAAATRAFSADKVFEAARLDEWFQEEKWGVDAEAKERESNLNRDFLALCGFIDLLR